MRGVVIGAFAALLVCGCASDPEIARLSPDNDRPPGHYAASYYSRSKAERRLNHIGKEVAKIGVPVAASAAGCAAEGYVGHLADRYGR